MYRIEAIPEKLGAHYRSEFFETKQLAESFRTEFLVDPQGLYFRIVRVRKPGVRSRAKQESSDKRTVAQPVAESAVVTP